jgi:hypothetical protein
MIRQSINLPLVYALNAFMRAASNLPAARFSFSASFPPRIIAFPNIRGFQFPAAPALRPLPQSHRASKVPSACQV